MLNADDFKTLLDNVANPVLVAEADYKTDNSIADFTVVFLNKMYRQSTFDFVKVGDKYSGFKSRLPSGIEWVPLAVQVLETGVTIEKEYLSTRTHTWYHMTMSRVANKFCVVTLENITITKVKDRTMEVIQVTDLLTGLPNRACFYDSLNKFISCAAESHTMLGLAILDLDDLKSVNDMSGHDAGDHIIKAGAKILLEAESKENHSFRLGDDEYVIIKSPIVTKSQMALFLNDIFNLFQKEHINVSIGATIYPNDEKDLSNLIRYADLAMRYIKHTGKNSVAFFDSNMYESFVNRAQLKQKIDDAISKRCFELYFQPQFTINNSKLRGFEALIRWHDDQKGWIGPSDFIPVAEETRSIIAIGRWVLDSAIQTLSKWQHEFGFNGIMSVNISPSQLSEPDFYEELEDMCRQYGINNSSLELEITEGILIENTEKILPLLDKIRALGIQLSLDDFGTGYASFRYLQQLPINTLKVDKTFIDRISAQDDFSTAIVKTIIESVQKKGLTTIAEGVEHNDQVDYLKQMHCECIQGFLWGKPMPKDRCEKLLAGDLSALDHIE